MKLNQLIECNVRSIFFFFKKYAENEAEGLITNLFLFFENALYKVKTCDHGLSFNICW